MAKLVSLATLRADTKTLANMRSTAFMTDAEVDRIINQARTELYDLLVELRGHEYFEEPITLSTTRGSAIVAFPSDFFEIITVIANWGAQQLEEIESLDHLGDQVDYRNWNEWAQWSPKAWRCRGQLLEFFPTPSAATQLEIRYVPVCRDLVGDADTMDGINGWDRLVSAKAAVEILGLQNLPASNAERVYAAARQRIEALASERAAANAPSIRDVRHGPSGARRGWWRRLPPPP